LPLFIVVIAWAIEKLRKMTANPPQVITQRIDGQVQVVDVLKPAAG
jgi:hypothetical protein